MATSIKCSNCEREVMMTRMSMITFKDLCYTCRDDEDRDNAPSHCTCKIFVSNGWTPWTCSNCNKPKNPTT